MNEKSQRYFLELSYKGSPFHGWQVQENAFTVQECLEKALSTYFRTPIAIMGSGRTDTGVHATQQVCHFDLTGEELGENFIKAVNAILPKEIAILGIRKVIPEAHARFDAIKRSYFYRIVFSKNPFLQDLSWQLFHQPDVKAMNEAAKILLEYEDFECFSKVHTEVKHFHCKIYTAYWELKEEQLLFHITANRFLRGMVRSIVGTLLEVGLGQRPVEDLHRIISSKDRNQAGKAVPAKGLYLNQIEYPTPIYLD
ncbi:MAG: tRNA pseudouridine(38-40) synthase TruA [Bacteroidetes bacterium]|nr:tRNA pseudouridine(38-40) synthase TruA [Bacteroidota bacterium]MDA1269070.1 tRNA pseudouridine(38-40) synthase TruA [Bacteroidota bacterium]